MRVKFLALTISLLCVWPAGCRSAQPSGRSGTAQAAEDNSPVIVEINGAPERSAAFERFVKSRLSDFYTQNSQGQPDSDQLRSRLLDEFIQRQVIVREAQRRNLQVTDEEIQRAVEDQHQQTSGAGSDQNQATLASPERVQEIVSDQLTLKFYEQEVLKDARVTPEEIENFYRQNQSRYQQRNGFYVREIRVAKAEEAQAVYQQVLKKPADFATFAREHSNAPTASNGGLIYYSTQQLPPVLEQAITPLKVGAVSRVVQSNYGFHIFKLEKRAEPLPLDKVRAEIEKDLLRNKNQALIDAFNEQALKAARIKVYYDRLGFTYRGNLNQAHTSG